MFLALYGVKVSIGESIFISLFSMGVVFVVLLVISYMIDLVAAVINKGTKKSIKSVANDVKNEEKISDDLVVVIAAAIASYLGTDEKHLKIKKIRRINNTGWRI